MGYFAGGFQFRITVIGAALSSTESTLPTRCLATRTAWKNIRFLAAEAPKRNPDAVATIAAGLQRWQRTRSSGHRVKEPATADPLLAASKSPGALQAPA